MKKFKPQGGLAALEVVIVAAIVAIFATAAVPKMARVLDKVQLDYEMKRLYSTLNFARSLGKSSTYKPLIFDASLFENQSGAVELQIRNDRDTIAKNRYEIWRPASSSVRYYRHYLSGGVKLDFDGASPMQIHFDKSPSYSSMNDTVTLTSKFGKAYVTADSVGRFLGYYEK